MFIGELGCWLVVFAQYLYNRYLRRTSETSQNGYKPVATEAEENDSIHVGESAILDPLVVPHVHGRLPLTGWKVAVLALPSCCDITGTTLMNVGLFFVAASIYQMTRGALVLFVGLFSVIFL